MPNIQPLEVMIVSAGFLVLCIVPALVAWADALSRRRARAAAVQLEAAQAARLAFPESATAPVLGAGEPTPFSAALAEAAPAFDALPETNDMPVLFEEGRTVEALPAASPATDLSAASAVPQSEVAEEPRRDSARADADTYEFRLQDLRRARLLDWPPAAVRNDAERHRAWQDGMRLVAQYQDRIDRAVLRGPYLPQSACFRDVEMDGGAVRVRYFVFRDLWPVAESQAAGEAVFEMDGAGDGVRARLENLPSASPRG